MPAGLVDAAAASAATFVTGLAGVNLLGDVDRGIYAVFFSAYLVATVMPTFLAFKPAEVIAVSLPIGTRLARVRQSLQLGLGPSLVGLIAILVAAAAASRSTLPSVYVPLATTAAIASIVSPAQDHVRALLHIDRRSWSAAAMSTVQFIVVVVGVGGLIALDAPPAWIPFGGLAAANVMSLSLGLLVARSERDHFEGPVLSFRQLASSGRWLLGVGLVPYASAFLGTMVIFTLAGPEVTGLAESARVAAQPILVLAVGLNAVLGPVGIESAIHRDFPSAQRAQRLYLGLIVLAGLAYLLVAGHDWVWNPMLYLVPTAYRLDGLVALTIVANVIGASMTQEGSELMGGRKERQMTVITLVSSPLLVLGSATAAVTGAFARPIGMIASGTARYGGYAIARSRMYAELPAPGGTDRFD